jgi:hypothetical protein
MLEAEVGDPNALGGLLHKCSVKAEANTNEVTNMIPNIPF